MAFCEWNVEQDCTWVMKPFFSDEKYLTFYFIHSFRSNWDVWNSVFLDIICSKPSSGVPGVIALKFRISIAEQEFHSLYHCATLSSAVKTAFAFSKTNYPVPCLVDIASTYKLWIIHDVNIRIIMNIHMSLMTTSKYFWNAELNHKKSFSANLKIWRANFRWISEIFHVFSIEEINFLISFQLYQDLRQKNNKIITKRSEIKKIVTWNYWTTPSFSRCR